MFPLHAFQILSPRLKILLSFLGFRHFLRLVVEDDEVARLEVEAVELVAGGLGVEDVFEDDEGGAARGGRDALADLSREALVERLRMCRYHDLW
jgi:hypothetical protein